MSSLHICPWCGERVDATSGHRCMATKPCGYHGCPNAGTMHTIIPFAPAEGETPEQVAAVEMATAEFRCSEHVGKRTILMFQPWGADAA